MSFDIKQFFRFVVSGYVCLLYYFGLLAGFSNLSDNLNAGSLASFSTVAFGSLALSVPIGFLIHELDISIRDRTSNAKGHMARVVRSHIYHELASRGSLVVLRALLNEPRSGHTAGDPSLAAFLEFAKYKDQEQLDAHIEKELSNRYSYVYSRVEAAVYAPALAVIFSALTGIILWGRLRFGDPIAGVLIVVCIGCVSVSLLTYIPTLRKEIDAIETLMVLNNREIIENLNKTTRPKD
jgi:hypothetical protein